ncbi:uncharacterized protein LOC131988339 [Centropristis striata]|uniref:uncharacterized protein LOC131988339 n=1 Tax=Centropristis striata TaxID=184440 RepID=UPI0027DF4844|nr:uncharacterized protein LOC131988339 [Centropristis striata]
MEDPLDGKSAEDIKEALENSNQALALARIQEYLEKKKNTPLNIAVTGESGSGKSTFVNAFRGLHDGDEGAALTGFKETTKEVTSYPHPNFPNVTLWDLPGIGTTKFPADKYLKHVGFERFDFFIIVSSDRFRENDVKLIKEIQKMGKKFYFVRSKIDHNLRDEKRKMKIMKSKFNVEKILKEIREDCTQGLQQQGVRSPQVFLVSSFHLERYEFALLWKTLERELSAHKRHALLLAMPNISLEVINKKKEAFLSEIKYWALLSAGGAAVPVPGFSFALDLGVLVVVVTRYVYGFGLDDSSLHSLANRSNVPLDDLMKIIVSPLAAKKITRDLVLKALLPFGNAAKLMAAEEASRFIPIFGIPAAMGLSFVSTYRILNTFLDMLAEDAQRVFKLALDISKSRCEVPVRESFPKTLQGGARRSFCSDWYKSHPCSVRLGVGSPIILAAILVMRVSLARLVTVSMLKKQEEQEEQYVRMGFALSNWSIISSIALDLSAAFNTVNHRILPTLDELSGSGSAPRWFKSLEVSWDKEVSKLLNLSTGVPQGGQWISVLVAPSVSTRACSGKQMILPCLDEEIAALLQARAPGAEKSVTLKGPTSSLPMIRPKTCLATSLLTSQPCWDMVAAHQPSTTPSFWTIQGCTALISEQDSARTNFSPCLSQRVIKTITVQKKVKDLQIICKSICISGINRSLLRSDQEGRRLQRAMDNPFEDEKIQKIKEIMTAEGSAAAAAKIQECLDEQNNIPLNIGITGESGSGKSTFVNAFRGVDNRDEGAAPTGCVETTMEPTPYPHPNFPNVTLWDLPGIGSPNFLAEKYLQDVGFERFDFFIIVSADRFRENDVKLALEIQKMKKKFYFVRSKIDDNLRNEERSQREFNAERTLQEIRKYCIEGFGKQGVESPQVFLVSSFDLHLYDFPLLQQTLEEELPAHKRDVLLLAMPNISLEVIRKKKEALQAKIMLYASASALAATVPVPGLSCSADLTMLAVVIKGYQVSFGLNTESLQNLACRTKVPLEDLRAVMMSPLSEKKINVDLIIKVLCFTVADLTIIAAEEGFRFVPFIGIPIASALSFAFTYKALSTSLDMLAEDAQKVFKKALGLDTAV